MDGALNWPLMLINICTFWLYANLILGLFNMLPFGPLDGLKVQDWSEGAFYAVLLIFAVPVLAMFFGMWSIALLQGLAPSSDAGALVNGRTPMPECAGFPACAAPRPPCSSAP